MIKTILLVSMFIHFELITVSKASESDQFLNEIFLSKYSFNDDSMTIESKKFIYFKIQCLFFNCELLDFNSIWSDIIKYEKHVVGLRFKNILK